jgi:predicted phage tail protein
MEKQLERTLRKTSASKVLEGQIIDPGPRKPPKSPVGTIAYGGAVVALGFFAVNAVATAVLCVGGIAALTVLTGRHK